MNETTDHNHLTSKSLLEIEKSFRELFKGIGPRLSEIVTSELLEIINSYTNGSQRRYQESTMEYLRTKRPESESWKRYLEYGRNAGLNLIVSEGWPHFQAGWITANAVIKEMRNNTVNSTELNS